MSTENMDRLKRLLLEGFGQGDMSVLDEVVAENFIEHQQGLPQGREGLKNVIRDLRRAFPDLSYTSSRWLRTGIRCGATSVPAARTKAPSWVGIRPGR